MMKFNLLNLNMMRKASALLKTRGPLAATAAIQAALSPAGTLRTATETRPVRDINPPPQAPASGVAAATATPPFVAELLAELGVHADPARRCETSEALNDFESAATHETPGRHAQAEGRFLPGSFANPAGTRQYKLYEPCGYAGETLPLIVMLHGCTQSPDDFAVGTRMNAIADERRCLVLYPAQSKSANGSGCWNWFQAADQHRDKGEPSIIAGMTREIIARYCADADHVYVAGLSAGGAMALIMGTVYPDLFTAVGVHSGLPYASAKDLPSALAAMKGSYRPASQTPSQGNPQTTNVQPVPIIVFHGDQDKTVNAGNAKHIMEQWTSSYPEEVSRSAYSGGSGRAYIKTSTKDKDGHVLAEEWTVQGAGHAWSGGSSSGSYTDPRGPDASREMVRFFLTQPKRSQRERP